ncbi:hypothetical protein K8640_05945 [Myxococcus sp. XM-1-1-1]|uniref:hypothetical protein n=1 Tax=Myxococcus sp. XM-1-1-1 TaxID=2874602 RepID=UPI001CBBB9C5|nr:hypothetical protein [Myxococcus sp. XM-1-1-1]MBZ4407745.1 hypothetical protein [Myxococcus sp. XM-1-1-1]
MQLRCVVGVLSVVLVGPPAWGQHLPESAGPEGPSTQTPPLVSVPEAAVAPSSAQAGSAPLGQRPYRRRAHIPLGMLLGGVGLASGAMVGLAAGNALTGCNGYPCSNNAALSLSLGVGSALGAASGVYLMGRWLRGQGSFGYTLLGATLGALPSSLMLTSSSDDVVVIGVLNLLVTPILGSFFGYRMSHSASLRAQEQELAQQAVWVPTFTRTKEGSLVGGLAGRF